MKLYRKLIRPMHSYPGPDYSPRVMPIEAEVKWYLEEEREQLENKYASYNEGSFSDLTFEEKFEPYICDNAIELLKKQEPAQIEIEGGGSTWWHVCGECHGSVDDSDLFCKHCGRPLINKTVMEGNQ